MSEKTDPSAARWFRCATIVAATASTLLFTSGPALAAASENLSLVCSGTYLDTDTSAEAKPETQTVVLTKSTDGWELKTIHDFGSEHYIADYASYNYPDQPGAPVCNERVEVDDRLIHASLYCKNDDVWNVGLDHEDVDPNSKPVRYTDSEDVIIDRTSGKAKDTALVNYGDRPTEAMAFEGTCHAQPRQF